MVSFQAPTSPNWRKRILELDDHDASNSKKRKLWEETQPAVGFLEKKSSKSESTNPVFEIELQLEAPLPFEWQRCLDIQSGQIHFYNTRTHKRTSKDPRKSTEPSSPDHHHHDHMSLDLELNLPCESQRKNQAVVPDHRHLPKDRNSNSIISGNLGDLLKDWSRDDHTNKKPRGGDLMTRCPSWLAFEREQQEMVATVCTRCHLLVMLSKSSLACPNCKFVHPPDQTPPQLSKPGLSLLC